MSEMPYYMLELVDKQDNTRMEVDSFRDSVQISIQFPYNSNECEVIHINKEQTRELIEHLMKFIE